MGLALVLYVVQYQKRMMRQNDEMKNKDAQYQEQLLQAIIDGQENERTRIASNLHDSLGASLSTIRLSVLMHGEEAAASKGFAEEVASLLSESIQEVRNISHNLLPGALKAYGLGSALQDLCDKLEESTSIKVEMALSAGLPRLPEKDELALFRIFQELINNTLKHAGASHIHIAIEATEGALVMKYSDNGKGFNAEEASSGLGMFTISSRLQSLQGNVDFDQKTLKGMACTITVPLKTESNALSSS